jgi:integrase
MPRARKPPRLEIRVEADGRRTWIIRDGQRYQRTGCLEAETERANDALRRYLSDSYRPNTSARRAAQAELGDMMMLYLDAREGAVARPAELRARLARLNEFWGGKVAADIKGEACRRYVRERGAVTAARRDLETLRAAVRLYAKEHGLDVTPAFDLPPNGAPRERWLTRQEAAKLLRAARRSPYHRHLVRFILIGLYTGTRHKAILGLQWMPNTTGGWVDLEKGVLHRRAQGARQSKKRQPPTRIASRLVAHMRRWAAADGGRRHVIRYGDAPVRRIEKAFRSVRELAGLDRQVTPHVLRHTRATWLAQAGVPVWEAAGSLGMTTETFERVYGHHHADFQKRAAEAY